MDTYTVEKNKKVTLTFTQIDDELTVNLNNNPIKTSGIIRMNEKEKEIEIDLSQDLKKGTNDLQVIATNSSGTAFLKGFLTVDNAKVRTWEVGRSHIGNGEFLNETFTIDYDKDTFQYNKDEPLTVTFTEIDDHVLLTFNDETYKHDKVPLRHNHDDLVFKPMLKRGTNSWAIKATNDRGMGSACLKGDMKMGQKTIREWNIGPKHEHIGDFLKEKGTIKLSESDEVTFCNDIQS